MRGKGKGKGKVKVKVELDEVYYMIGKFNLEYRLEFFRLIRNF